MHFHTDRTAHTVAFAIPVMGPWLEWEKTKLVNKSVEVI